MATIFHEKKEAGIHPIVQPSLPKRTRFTVRPVSFILARGGPEWRPRFDAASAGHERMVAKCRSHMMPRESENRLMR